MRTSAVATGLFAAAAYATSSPPTCNGPPCMTAAQAQTVATNFGNLISDYSTANAEAYLTADYTDYSSSVNTLIDSGCPNGPLSLDAPTFTSRAAFIQGQGSQPDIPFNQENLWYTCDTVFIRWSTTVAPGAPETVTGIIALETQYNATAASPFQIQTVYSEFNSGAWLVDLGVFKPTCPPPPPPKNKRSLGSNLPARMA